MHFFTSSERATKEVEKRFLNVSQKQSIRQHKKRVHSGRWKNACTYMYEEYENKKNRENKSEQRKIQTRFFLLSLTHVRLFIIKLQWVASRVQGISSTMLKKEWNKKCLTGGKTAKKKKKKWFWSVEQGMNAVCNFFRFLSLYAHTCWIANSLSRSMQFPPPPSSSYTAFLWPWLRLLQCSRNFIRVFLLSDEDDDFINFGWQFLLLFHLHIAAAAFVSLR